MRAGGRVRRAVIRYMNALEPGKRVRPQDVVDSIGMGTDRHIKKMVREDMSELAKAGLIKRIDIATKHGIRVYERVGQEVIPLEEPPSKQG